MKRFLFSLLAISALAIVSCSKVNSNEEISTKKFIFTASSESLLGSRAGLGPDGKSLVWKIGDQAQLYFPKTGDPGKAVFTTATVTSIDERGVATFSADIPAGANTSEVIASYNDIAEASENDFHPYCAGEGNNYTRHRLIFPTTQNPIAGNYDSASIPLVGHWVGAEGDPADILFKNPVALIAIDVNNTSGKTIESIIFSNTSSPITGYFYYLAADRDGFYWKASKENAKEISLTGNISNGKYYIFVPGSGAELSGVKVMFTTSDGYVATFTNPTALTIERNKIYNIGAFTLTDEAFVDGLAFSDTKVNMDESFYQKLIKSCTGSASPYTLEAKTEIDNITVTPNNSGKCQVVNNSGKWHITQKSSVSFTSASSGDAILVLYCAIAGGNKALSLTWKDKDGVKKEVPTKVNTALTNSTGSTVYFDSDTKALNLSLPGVQTGDVITIALSGSNSHRIYKFLWKAAPKE